MYVENVFLNKSLALLGAQASVDARGRVASESVVMPLIATTETLELRSGSTDSIINGFTFLGGSFSSGAGHGAIESTGGPIDGLQILNNRIREFTAGSGVFLNDTGINITVNQNDIDGTMKTGNADLFHLDTDNFDGFWFTNNRVVNGITGTGFFVDGNRNVDAGLPGSQTPTTGARTPKFTGNFINNNFTGVNLGRKAWGDGPITGNTFSNNALDGLQGGPKNSTISQNTFDGNGRNGLTLTGFSSTSADAGARSNTVSYNCFTRNGLNPPLNTGPGAGIVFSASQAAGTISTNVANQNNITGNFMGARYPAPGTEMINATNNWWGAVNGPGLPDGSGSGDGVDGRGFIVFTPFRTTPAAGTPCSAGPPATLTLSPLAATNTVGTPHCVTATVKDAMGRPVPDVTVRFTVSGVGSFPSPSSGAGTTDANGQATFCYTSTLAGADAISAFADTNSDGMLSAGEPFGAATKTWVAGAPATLVLTPAAATNTVGTTHCVTAIVRDVFGNPVSGVIVRFSVGPSVPTTFPSPSSGSASTNASGQATFCYTASLPGVDAIHAFADSNANGTQDAGEPFGDSEKTWTPPVSTELCEVKITDGGWITANNGDRANFGGNAKVGADGTPQGQQEYQDQGPVQPMNVHSTEITATSCSQDRTTASIFGKATIDGAGSYVFRIDVTDGGSGGSNDAYGIMLETGYMSGQHRLGGGNVTIH